MKTLIILFACLSTITAFAADRSYDSYNDIVDKLSAERNQSVHTQMQVTVPTRERLELSLGVVNSSTSIEHAGIGSINQNGFAFGAAVPMMGNEFYGEGYAQFFNTARNGDASTSLRQFELRISHKEPLSFAIWNLGLGGSARLLQIESPLGDKNVRTPAVAVMTGLERRVSERISLAGDLEYLHSLSNGNDDKNSFELLVRMNYHL